MSDPLEPWKKQTCSRDEMICDGCQFGPGQYDGERLTVCGDCGYAVCDDCKVHACTNASWEEGEERCSGAGWPCPCRSCRSELVRQLDPRATEEVWMGRLLPPFGRRPDGDGDFWLHHNLARGSCRCEWSNFGASYANMCGAAGGTIGCYMGGRGGRQFKGPVKPRAQIALEQRLMYYDVPALPVTDRICENPGCKALGMLRCSRCKSAWYCSRDCQAAHYRGKDRPHKKSCGLHYPQRDWKYVTEDERTYKEKHGHLPGEVVWDGVPSLTALAMHSLRATGHPLVREKDCTASDVAMAASVELCE